MPNKTVPTRPDTATRIDRLEERAGVLENRAAWLVELSLAVAAHLNVAVPTPPAGDDGVEVARLRGKVGELNDLIEDHLRRCPVAKP